MLNASDVRLRPVGTIGRDATDAFNRQRHVVTEDQVQESGFCPRFVYYQEEVPNRSLLMAGRHP